MQKEKSVKSYTRRTKSGKTVVVHAYKAKYDAAEEMRKALAKKEGAGKELANRKKQVEQPIPDNKLGFSAEEFKAWYHWDTESDPKNKAALKVEKTLKKSMGAKAYKKFYDDMTDGYSARGHNKAFKGLESSLSSQNKETTKSTPKKETTSKTTTSPVDEGVFLKKYDSKEKAAIKKGIREARTSGKTLYITKDSDNQLSIGENTYGDNVVGTIHPNGKLYRGEVTSKSNGKSTNGATTKSVTDEDGRNHSTKRNSLGISPAEWAAYNSGGVGITGMSDKEVKAAIKHVESTLKKNLGSKVKTFKTYLDDTAQDGGDFKADMKKLQGIMSAKDKSPKKREADTKAEMWKRLTNTNLSLKTTDSLTSVLRNEKPVKNRVVPRGMVDYFSYRLDGGADSNREAMANTRKVLMAMPKDVFQKFTDRYQAAMKEHKESLKKQKYYYDPKKRHYVERKQSHKK